MEKKFVIETSDIQNNVSVLREKANNARIYAVLKGNGYGMGLLEFAKVLYNCGIRYFAVTDLNDALQLKEVFEDTGVLLLTPCYIEDDINKAILSDITLSVDSLENASLISETALKLKKCAVIHIKIDTGMGRYGFLPNQDKEILSLSSLPSIQIEGIFTHLHSAFNEKETLSLNQFNMFNNLISKLETAGLDIPVKHISNSIAIFRFPQMNLTAVRAGSALIGRVSSICKNTGLKKVGKLFATVTDVRTLPKNHNIGYAALYKTKTKQKVATVNVGYSDGITVTKANDTFRFIDILRYIYNDLKLLISPNKFICKYKDIKLFSLGRIGMTNLVLDANLAKDIKPGDTVEIDTNPLYLSPLIKREYK